MFNALFIVRSKHYINPLIEVLMTARKVIPFILLILQIWKHRGHETYPNAIRESKYTLVGSHRIQVLAI